MENRIITWNQPLGNPKCPYCYRYVLNLGLFAIRVHKWVASDDLRALHDHPYCFITFILRGSYYDISKVKTEKLTAGCIRYRPATYQHAVQLAGTMPCWSLVLSGPFIRQWGFWLNNKFIRREKYFKGYGHVCD